jgi:hypothetical protein
MSRRTSVFIQPSSHGSTIVGKKNNICIVIYFSKRMNDNEKMKKFSDNSGNFGFQFAFYMPDSHIALQ